VTPTDVDAFMSQPVDMDQFHEVTLALLDNCGEVQRKDAEAYPRPRSAAETAAAAAQEASEG
jgi:hypothetical protein